MAISLIQSAEADSAGSLVTTLTVTLSTGATLGNLLVVNASAGNNGMTFGAPSGWTQAVQNIPAGANPTTASALYYLTVDSGHAGATSFAFTLSSAHSFLLQIEEWNATNGWQATPLDQTAQGDTSGSPTQSTILSSGTTATTTQASELWIAGLAYKSGLQTESSLTSGWSKDRDDGNVSSVSASMLSQVASATGTAQVQYTIGTAEYWSGVVATFLPVVASGQTFVGTARGVGAATAKLVGVGFVGAASGSAVANAMLTPVALHIIAPPTFTPIAARYMVRVRDPNRRVIDPITTYQKLDLVERFNAAGTWSIQLDANDPAAALLAIPGYGISVARTNYNILTGQVINSRIEMAGPMTGISRQMAGNSLIVNGSDDMIGLVRRDAWPPKAISLTYGTLTTAPTRYYTGATSGATLLDSSPAAQNATLSGTFATGQTPFVDDTAPSVTLTGSGSGTVSVPTAGLPSGNPAMTLSIWVQPTTIGATIFAYYGLWGTNHSAFHIAMDSTGHVYAGTYFADTAHSTAALVANVPHMITGTWDGTTLSCYVDGVLTNSATPGAATIPASGTTFAISGVSGGSYLTGGFQQAGFWPHAMTAKEVTGLYNLSATDYVTLVRRTPGLLRYYRLNDTSATAVDSSPMLTDGSYVAPYTQSLPGLIVDPDTCTKFANGYVTVPTTGLPTGNAAFSLLAWFQTSVTGVNQVMVEIGTPANTEAGHLWIAPTGVLACGLYGTGHDLLSTTNVTDGNPHQGAMTWDGTNARIYLDGAQIATSATLGPAALTYGSVFVGRNILDDAPYQGNLDEVQIYNTTLTAAQISTNYTTGRTAFAAIANDTITGDAETVLKHYVDVNAGPSALFNRQIPGLVIETNAHQGTTVTGNARFDHLVLSDGSGLLQLLAVAGGGLGFRIKNVAGVPTFQVYTPVDRSASVYFSQALDNLIDFTYTDNAPNAETGGNVYLVGGGGQGTDRIFTLSTDPTSIGLWGWSEQFQDARDTTDIPTMLQRGEASLLINSEVTTFSATISPSPQTVFGVHFDLGDKVSAVVDGAVFSELIREVDITLDAGKAEVVTPIMGTPHSITIRNALWKHLKGMTRDISLLQRLLAVD